MDKNLQFLELKRMDPDVISPAKRKKTTMRSMATIQVKLPLSNQEDALSVVIHTVNGNVQSTITYLNG